MRRLAMFLLLSSVACAILSIMGERDRVKSESEKSESEKWNEGVGYLEEGDATNALRVLRPMMLTRSHGARAAEVVAKLELESGNNEEAAAAAQIALRANPSDERAAGNFACAVRGLPEFVEAKHIDEVLKAAQGKDPGSLMLAATYDARDIMKESGGYLTNVPSRVIDLSDRLTEKAKRISDAWIPVKEAICQSVTNEEQAATIVMQIDQARGKSRLAARQLEDLEQESYSTMSDVEHDCTRFLKMIAMPPAAIGEDLVAQSNAWQDVESFNGRSWQQDALDFTRAFRAKFPAWARAYEQQAESNTNRPPFTAEDQAKISALATELEKLQIECVESPLPPSQEKALEIIREIQELLPKDGGGQGQQDRQSSQDDETDGQEGEPQEEESNEGNEADAMEDREVDAILRRAQERSDEHEADKRARMRKAPLPPNERDW